MDKTEKLNMLKDSIEYLYSKEGRSISAISRILKVDRSRLSKAIREWDLPAAEHRRHMTPSTEKFINRNRSHIKKMLDADASISDIARQYNIPRSSLVRTFIMQDEVLKKAYEDNKKRAALRHMNHIDEMKTRSGYEYDSPDLDGEEWRGIPGYDGYQVSNMGRVKALSERYNAWYLITPVPNKNNGRLYISVVKNKYSDNAEKKNLQLARVVAAVFHPNDDKRKNTVNHKDGNVANNRADNLEWVSQYLERPHEHNISIRKA